MVPVEKTIPQRLSKRELTHVHIHLTSRIAHLSGWVQHLMIVVSILEVSVVLPNVFERDLAVALGIQALQYLVGVLLISGILAERCFEILE